MVSVLYGVGSDDASGIEGGILLLRRLRFGRGGFSVFPGPLPNSSASCERHRPRAGTRTSRQPILKGIAWFSALCPAQIFSMPPHRPRRLSRRGSRDEDYRTSVGFARGIPTQKARID
ncbi:hypothetical protein HNY73_011684 [Argiope bruennichi]|uniref:Uncharacterized protein n=1 Tax=Argiope bruennichi TaxID=94029 RepID=A0A8T0F3V1_ARGBR|nr:hypothetical protein HNY73_011684 [Argiope bruennichi]